jgi:hypothetical protein
VERAWVRGCYVYSLWFTPKDYIERTWLNEIPFSDNVIESPRAASFCREAITMKSVFKTFSVNLFAQSHLNILLKALCNEFFDGEVFAHY